MDSIVWVPDPEWYLEVGRIPSLTLSVLYDPFRRDRPGVQVFGFLNLFQGSNLNYYGEAPFRTGALLVSPGIRPLLPSPSSRAKEVLYLCRGQLTPPLRWRRP